MQIADQAFEPVFQHVSIDLRRRDIGMAEQRLHDPEIGAVVQQVAGEGVTQHVRADLFRRDAAGCSERLEFAGEELARHKPAVAERRKQPFRF